MYAYGEFRQSFNKCPIDQRIVFFGMRYILENYLMKKWTVEDVEMASLFFSTHNSGNSSYPFPHELFLSFIEECDGYFPVKVEALPEGTVIYPHTPVYAISAEGKYAKLVTYLETILTMIWVFGINVKYPTTVATFSRRCKSVIAEYFSRSVDDDDYNLLNSRLHDFGYRGCTSNEQALIGGVAHLLNFCGSDTMPAAFYAQFHLNLGNPVASSIPATEHSVMTSFPSEKEAMEHVIEQFGDGIYSIVMDSYDYKNALETILPCVASRKITKNGVLVIRPDSGDPSAVVLMALQEAEKVFGSTVNSKGFKVLNKCSVIQGDGVTFECIATVLEAVLSAGYSAQNVAFGMGGNLLQRVHRDVLAFATKLSFIKYEDGVEKCIMKAPKMDGAKRSLPGEFKVIPNKNGIPVVYPAEFPIVGSNLLQVVYDRGPVDVVWPSFSEIKSRLEKDWESHPKLFDPVSEPLKLKIDATLASLVLTK